MIKHLNNDKGFTLIEILVAMALVAVTFVLVPISLNDDQENLESTITDINRAAKYAANEAILTNAPTRLLISITIADDDDVSDEDLDNEVKTITYSVQHGPSSDILLPPAKDLGRLSQNQLEKHQKEQEKFQSKWSDTEQYAGKTLADGVYFQGLASSYQKDLLTEGNLSVYFYPSGEKDDALIILGTRDEVATLEIMSFDLENKIKYFSRSQDDGVENSFQFRENKSNELYDEWIKQ